MRLRDKPAPSTGEAKPEGRGDEMGSETQVTKRGDEMGSDAGDEAGRRDNSELGARTPT